MRKNRLLTATALCLTLSGIATLVLSGEASAATTISTATTTPLKTSTSGAITVDSAGSITLTTGTAITIDSNDAVTLNGAIAMSSSAAGSTGILINSGHTGDLTVAANITVTDDYTATDTLPTGALDGIVDGPFSDGKTRYGIHSLGGSPFTGNVSVTSASTLKVEGDNSYAIRFENNIAGTFTMDGAITMEGNNNTGVSLENGVTGNVYLSGSINTHGKDSSAVKLAGDFGGNIIIDGSYTGTGYATINALTAAQTKAVLAIPDDMYQSGPLVTIAGNVAKGVLFSSVITADTTQASNTDQDGNGITDSLQTSATLAQYGKAPALLIGSGSQNITLGGLTYASTAISPPAVNYGLLVRGTIGGYGTYSGVDSNAVQIGGTGHTVNIANGIGLSGTITSTAYGATTTALSLQSGATTPQLDLLGGSIRGTATSATTSDGATTPTYTTVTATARAIDIAAGANLPKINISSVSGIYAAATGSTTQAIAIRDQSNTLTTINNNNVISSTITASDDNGDSVADTVTHRAIAIDTHTNTAGLTLTQTDTALTDDTIAAPYIMGDILLGSGNDAISSSGGSIYGNIDFGGGANSFKLTNDAVYLGQMTGSGTVAMDISSGKLALTSGSALNLTSLHVGATGVLLLTLNTTAPTTPIFTNSGTAIFDNGAQINLSLNNILTSPTKFTLMTASNINLGNITTADLGTNVPYIYHADLATNAGNTTLYANLRLKNQTEAGYSNNQYTALIPVLTAVAQDSGAVTALTSQTTKSGFDGVYNQYLPDYSGENLLNLSLGSQSLNRSLGSLTLIPTNGDGQYWLQEYGYKTKRDYGDTAGFESTGFSFAGGREQSVYGNQTIGVYLSFTSASPLDTFAVSKEDMVNSDLTVGGYWRIKRDAFKAWAHAGAGFASFETTRELLNSNVVHIATAKWNGFSYSAGGGASYAYKWGPIAITPQVLTDFYGLNEAKHSETGGGDYFDLAIAKRDGHLFNSTALLNVSYDKLFAKPELWVGWKQNISADIADTVANFKNQTPFTLTGGNLKGGGMVAGFRVSADNEYSYFSLEGDYEKQDVYTNYSVSLRTRFQF